MSGLPGYDNWATGGRYHSAPIIVWCAECEEWTRVTAETDYGATDWDKDACDHCKAPFPDDAKWEDDEPPCD